MFKIMGSWILNNVVLTSAIVIFSLMLTMIASNALWYQNAHHSSPMFNTRDVSAVEGKMVTNSVRKRSAANDQATGKRNDGQQYDHELVAELQRGLKKHGLYASTIDGLMGRNTQAAIISFQTRYGMKVTGEVSVKLLTQVLQIQPEQRSNKVARVEEQRPVDEVEKVKPSWESYHVIPTPRPRNNGQRAQLAALKPSVKPVAKPAVKQQIVAPATQVKTVNIKPTPKPKIESARVKTQRVKSIGDIVNTADKQTTVTQNTVINNVVNNNQIQGTGLQARLAKPLVAKIQQGLRIYGISNVNVDGQADEQTTTAIRYFQRAHKMEINGIPSPTLLNKMKEIGIFKG